MLTHNKESGLPISHTQTDINQNFCCGWTTREATIAGNAFIALVALGLAILFAAFQADIRSSYAPDYHSYNSMITLSTVLLVTVIIQFVGCILGMLGAWTKTRGVVLANQCIVYLFMVCWVVVSFIGSPYSLVFLPSVALLFFAQARPQHVLLKELKEDHPSLE